MTVSHHPTPRHTPPRSVLVTGATGGVGLALTQALVARGHHVIMAVRDPVRGAQARDQLVAQHPQARVRVEHLDLADLDSVRALGQRDLEVDVLINNAGVGFDPLRLTREGVVSQFAANHLGHFGLTALLFERLERRGGARVVTVTSTLAKSGRLELNNLDGSQGFRPLKAYAQSKLANALFGAELDRRLRARGADVRSVLVHPGVPRTAMQQKATGLLGLVVRAAASAMGKPPSHGASAVLEAALSSEVEGGALLAPGAHLGDAPRRERPWPSLGDLEGAAQLWACSERLTQLHFLPG